MTSERTIAANRRNARNSTGPRTEGGKAKVARNALRHGLRSAAVDHGDQPQDVERIARLIAGTAGNSAQYEQAVIIAESALLISRIRVFRIKAIERFRERLPSPFYSGSPLPQEVDGLARHQGLGNVDAARNIIDRLIRGDSCGRQRARGRSERTPRR